MMEKIKYLYNRILDEIGFFLKFLIGTCLMYIVVSSQLVIIACPADFLMIIGDYDPKFDLGPIQGEGGSFKLIPVIARGVAAFYYNLSFFMYSFLMFVYINFFYSIL